MAPSNALVMLLIAVSVHVSTGFQLQQRPAVKHESPLQKRRKPSQKGWKAQNETKDFLYWRWWKKMYQKDVALRWETCKSDDYNQRYKSNPKVDLTSLEIPSGVNVLFYGHSFMSQLVNNILVANENTLIKDGVFHGFEGKRLKNYDFGDDAPGGLVKYAFAVNSTFVEVQNRKYLQSPKYAKTYLSKFLREHNFDIAFFMNPHPTCWYKNDCILEGQMTPIGKDSDTEMEYTAEGDIAGNRSDVLPLWEVINRKLKGEVYEVEAWCEKPRPRELFHADDEHIIRTFSHLENRSCNKNDKCHTRKVPLGHQCQPGTLTSIVQEIVAKIQKWSKAVTSVPAADPSKEARWCQNGILSAGKCCGASCGTCGGHGCTTRPGGYKYCCTKAFESTCRSITSIACEVPSTQAVTTDAVSDD